MGDLAGWPYYKIISVTGQSGSGTDYQIELEIGDSAGGDFHLEGHCTNFPQDIRITDDDGTTLLDHFVEDLTADPIVVQIEVKDDLGSNQTIRVYYGKSGETTSSNGNDTYIEFDDISTESPEPWTEVDSSGRITIDRNTDERIEVNGIQRDEDVYLYQTKTTDSSVLYAKYYADTIGGTQSLAGIVGISDTLNDSYSWLNGVSIQSNNEGGQLKLRAVGDSSGSKSYGTYININIDTYYWLKLVIDGTTATIYVYSDATMDTLVGSNSVTIGDVSYSYIYGPVSFNTGQSYASGLYYVDDIRVRKYNSPEPAFSSAGTEQSPGHPTMRRWSGIPGMQYLGRRSW